MHTGQRPPPSDPAPEPQRYLLHREASSQVPRTPSSSVSQLDGEAEVLKDGSLKLAAMDSEAPGCRDHQGHESSVDTNAREKERATTKIHGSQWVPPGTAGAAQ